MKGMREENFEKLVKLYFDGLIESHSIDNHLE